MHSILFGFFSEKITQQTKRRTSENCWFPLPKSAQIGIGLHGSASKKWYNIIYYTYYIYI